MLAKPSILVIEDNPENLELVTYLLRASGYTPLVAEDGVAGMELARAHIPDLVLCDIHMPGKNGFEVAEEFKKDDKLKAIPLIALTAYAMLGDRDHILASGFDKYLSKPINPETFIQEIEALLLR